MNLRISTALVLTWALAAPALGGPLHDPFLEAFQVGTYADPDALATAYGFPAGLLNPALPEANYLDAARTVLETDADGGSLTHAYLRENFSASRRATWLSERQARLDLLAGEDVSPPADGYLAYELAALAFFQSVDQGNPERAENQARDILDRADALGLPARVRFVWQLRADLSHRLTEPVNPAVAGEWPGLFDLGPYDFANAWALWTAHCRDLKRPLLPPSWNASAQAIKLAGLRRSWLTPDDISGSAFSADLKVGLGARLLREEDLARHLAANPDPPQGFSAQGWWVGGQRTLRRGESGFYETLAGRTDLRDGWRLDVWRRASEIHLLAGRWERGLVALDHALALAAKQPATDGLRKRLWQWTEQATVLAVAQGEDERAASVLQMGLDAFVGKDLESYRADIAHWADTTGDAPDGVKAGAAWTVASGLAGPMVPADATVRQRLVAAADTPLFNLWVDWGLAICDHEGLAESGGLDTYRARLSALADGPVDVADVLETIHLRTAHGLDPESVLDILLDQDIQTVSAGRTSPALSRMPALARQLKGHWLDLHALLGLSLVAGDMRGTVALTYYLPSRGLDPLERLLFLYPLPTAGPLRAALLAADSDPRLILAVARNESLFEPSIRSRAGALGWMQIMPFHYPASGHQPGPGYWGLPRVSIAKGDALLVENRRRYDGNPYLALAAYNAGPGAASRWLKQLGGDPHNEVYLAWIGYPETRNYVEKVLIDREIYDWILSARD